MGSHIETALNRVPAMIFFICTLCILAACGGDPSTNDPAYYNLPSGNDDGWVLIEDEDTVTTSASIDLYGEAFSDVSYSSEDCPVGLDMNMVLTWANQSSGTTGNGYLGYTVVPGSCEHRWFANVPLIEGKNVIVITVSGSNRTGSSSITVTREPGV